MKAYVGLCLCHGCFTRANGHCAKNCALTRKRNSTSACLPRIRCVAVAMDFVDAPLGIQLFHLQTEYTTGTRVRV